MKRKVISLFLIAMLVLTFVTPVFAAGTYTVRSGDVLWKIAQLYNTTWQKLTEINQLKNPHLIFPGQVINLEETPTTTASDKGNTLFKAGTYRSEKMGVNAPIVIDVTFSAEKIEKIAVVSHNENKAVGDVAMDRIGKEIVQRQSLNVDSIAGATLSSAAFKSAVRETVEKAGADPSKLMTPAVVDTKPLPDEHVEVVVVGGGGAGLAATVTAAENGIDVILVEKLGILGGSSARTVSVSGADTQLQAKAGIKVTSDDLYKTWAAPVSANLHPDLVNEEFVKILSVNSGKNVDWLYGMGTDFGTPSGAAHSGVNGERVGWSIITSLVGQLDKRGTDYRLNTTATELVTDGRDVVGVKVKAPNGTYYTIYAKAVILATGSYFANPEMTAKYKPGFEKNPFDVSIGCDGSGYVMAEKAGGMLKNMDIVGNHAVAGTYNGVSRSLTLPAGNGAIAVTADGKRYANEAGAYADFTAATLKQSQVYVIMDQKMMDMGAIKNDRGLSNIVDMYTVANTPEELAKKLGINPAGLASEIKKYTGFVKNGKDDDFGKPASKLTSDFTTGPYYGVKAQVENHTVYGGVAIDNGARVLRADNTVIKGLYAAGEVAQFKEAGRAPLTFCIESGRAAIRNIMETLLK